MLEQTDKLGLNFVVGIDGPLLGSEDKKLLSELKPAGVILFRKNIAFDSPDSWIDQLNILVKELRSCVPERKLIVSVDHEGGLVHRFPEPITRFPEASKYRHKCLDVAAVMATELRALDLDLGYSPVLDIDTEQNNPIIGARAFSKQTDEVCQSSLEFINSLEANGILACGKHFPGHGDTTKDSHLELPVVTASSETLFKREILPFKNAIDAGLQFIMTAHVIYRSLEKEVPATLSKKIINDILRKQLKFNGVVITDDLEMKALDHYSYLERCKLSLEAGCDLLLVGNPKDCNPLKKALEIKEQLGKLLNSGGLEKELLRKSQTRVEKLLSYIEKIQNNRPE